MSKTRSEKGGKDGKGKGGGPIAVVLAEKTAKDLFLALALALGYPINKKGGKKGKKGGKSAGNPKGRK